MPTRTFYAQGVHGKANARADASNFWRALLRQGVRRADMDGFTYADGSVEVSWTATPKARPYCAQAEQWAALEAAEDRRVAREERELVGNHVEHAPAQRELKRVQRRVVLADHKAAFTLGRQRRGSVKREGPNWVVTFWEVDLA